MFIKVPRKPDGVEVQVVRTAVTYLEPKGAGSVIHFIGTGRLETSLSVEEVKDLLDQEIGRFTIKKPRLPQED
jgi:hypothetical protein